MNYLLGGLSVLVAGNVALVSATVLGGFFSDQNTLALSPTVTVSAIPEPDMIAGDIPFRTVDQSEAKKAGSMWQVDVQHDPDSNESRMRIVVDALPRPGKPWTRDFDQSPFLGIYCSPDATRLHFAAAPHHFIETMPTGGQRPHTVELGIRFNDGESLYLTGTPSANADGIWVRDSAAAIRLIRTMFDRTEMTLQVRSSWTDPYALTYPVTAFREATDPTENICNW